MGCEPVAPILQAGSAKAGTPSSETRGCSGSFPRQQTTSASQVWAGEGLQTDCLDMRCWVQTHTFIREHFEKINKKII